MPKRSEVTVDELVNNRRAQIYRAEVLPCVSDADACATLTVCSFACSQSVGINVTDLGDDVPVTQVKTVGEQANVSGEGAVQLRLFVEFLVRGSHAWRLAACTRPIGKDCGAHTVRHMKTTKLAIIIAATLSLPLLFGVMAASGAVINSSEITPERELVAATVAKAVTIQEAAQIPWLDAANIAVSLQPGGGHNLTIVDDVIIYQTDEDCLGGWLEGIDQVTVTECETIKWPAYLPD